MKFWPHQIRSINKYIENERILDASSPGTGKTMAAIAAFALRRSKGGKCALIVAPKTLLESAWGDDIDKFNAASSAISLTYSVAYSRNREQAFAANADVYITNTDAAVWLSKKKDAFFSKFDTLIIDELSNFKHHTSKRSKAMRKIAKHFAYRSGLTGTPTSNSITDIWHQTMILDDGERLGTSFYNFRDAVCKPVIHPSGEMKYTKWVDKEDAHVAVSQILSDMTIRHDFDDVMKHVPSQTQRLIYFRLPPKLMNAYNELKDTARLLVEEGEVSAVNAAVLRGKLLQAASGSVYGEGGAVIIDNSRVELIVELISKRQHSVVFWNWGHQREALVKELEKRKIVYAEITKDTKDSDRQSVVKNYQNGDYQTIMMHPQTGAHGLTLTRGTSVIWCSPTDRADLLSQGDARIRRGTQSQLTESIRVCAKDTLEEPLYNRTFEKLDAMSQLMEMLK